MVGIITVFHESKVSIKNYLLENLIKLLLREESGGTYCKKTMTGAAVAYLMPCSLQCSYTLSYRGWRCIAQFARNIAREILRLY